MSHASYQHPPLRLVHAEEEPAVEPSLEKGKPRPRLFRALGDCEPPASVEVGDASYRLVEVLKHDSWAATAIYRSRREKIVCKFNRQQPIGLLPMRWLGRRLAARENYLLRRLADLPGVPAWRGPVTEQGKTLDHAAAHVFVEGHPMTVGEELSQEFFAQLQHTVQAMHARGLAYVDLHKGENVLVGDDSRSYLIDFQVCYIQPRSRLLARLLGPVERALQAMDLYHLRKHLCAHRPDLSGLTLLEFNQQNDRPWWIKAHRAVAVPLRTLRRRLLVLLGIRKGTGGAASEHFAEDAIRRRAAVEPAAAEDHPADSAIAAVRSGERRAA